MRAKPRNNKHGTVIYVQSRDEGAELLHTQQAIAVCVEQLKLLGCIEFLLEGDEVPPGGGECGYSTRRQQRRGPLGMSGSSGGGGRLETRKAVSGDMLCSPLPRTCRQKHIACPSRYAACGWQWPPIHRETLPPNAAAHFFA